MVDVYGPGEYTANQGSAGVESWPVTIDGDVTIAGEVSIDTAGLASELTLTNALAQLQAVVAALGPAATAANQTDALAQLASILTALDPLASAATTGDVAAATAAVDAVTTRLGETLDVAVGNLPATFPNQHNQPLTLTELQGELPLATEQVQTAQATLLDYDGGTDPVYVGKADQGTATSAAAWTVQKLGYTSGLLTSVQEIAAAVWDDRASLGWVAY